jgi:uncharacterized protein (TIGR00297 family)
MPGRSHSEHARQLVHILFGAGALLLRYLAWWQAAAVAFAALIFNVLVLPRLAPALYRPADRAHRFSPGIALYPLAVLLLIVAFPRRPDIAAAAWGILAFGDGMASVVGRRAGRRRLPWNREKSVEGTMAFFLSGAIAGVGLAWWCRPAVVEPPAMWFSLAAPIAAALAAALVETIPIRLDDNLSVPATAAAVLWMGSVVTPSGVDAIAGAAVASAVPALAVNVVVAGIGWRARTVSPGGAIGGAAIGTLVVIGAGWPGWALLVATFVAATAASRAGIERKTLLGIAEERGGRRGAGNAVANTGIAAIAALLAVLTTCREAALIAFAAALTAGGSDTVASEIGKAFGRGTFLVPSFRLVAPGTPGAISREGTAAGLAAAGGLAALAGALALIPMAAVLPIVAGATLGAFVESALGATLEAPGIVNNDVLNFLNTAIAAAAAPVLWYAWT